MKNVVLLTLFLYGCLHLIGFVKAIRFAGIKQLFKNICKPAGLLCFLTTLQLVIVLILFFLMQDWWPIMAIIVIVLTQILIILVRRDVKFGTLSNSIIWMGNLFMGDLLEKASNTT